MAVKTEMESLCCIIADVIIIIINERHRNIIVNRLTSRLQDVWFRTRGLPCMKIAAVSRTLKRTCVTLQSC